jgi:hypothetical protein
MTWCVDWRNSATGKKISYLRGNYVTAIRFWALVYGRDYIDYPTVYNIKFDLEEFEQRSFARSQLIKRKETK